MDKTKEWGEYCEKILPIFSVVEDKSVLEIGCLTGSMFPVIQEHAPASHTAIEPHASCCRAASIAATKLGYTIDIHNVLYEEMQFDNTFDVIICTGLAYHLLHPFHLVETICNMEPEFVIFETLGSKDHNYHQFHLSPEKHNIPGSKQVNRKSIPWSLNINPVLFEEAFNLIGYETQSVDSIVTQHESKLETVMYLFRKTYE